jgi:hypothetical protein
MLEKTLDFYNRLYRMGTIESRHRKEETAMMIITKAIRTKLEAAAARQIETGESSKVAVLKLFDPYGSWTLYVTEMSGGILFGFATGVDFPELGYSSLEEITDLKKFGQPRIERDKWFDDTPINDIINGARP